MRVRVPLTKASAVDDAAESIYGSIKMHLSGLLYRRSIRFVRFVGSEDFSVATVEFYITECLLVERPHGIMHPAFCCSSLTLSLCLYGARQANRIGDDFSGFFGRIP